MKLTIKQQNVINHLRNFPNSWHSFDARTLNSLVKKGLVEVVSKERFREDDQETVYWREYQIVKTDLEKALI